MAKKRARREERENPEVNFLGLSGKTWLILGGVAVGALLLWKLAQARKAAAGAPSSLPGSPGGVAGIGCPCPAPAPAPTPSASAAAATAPEPEVVADEFGGGEML